MEGALASANTVIRPPASQPSLGWDNIFHDDPNFVADSQQSPQTNSFQRRRRVSFSQVHIREHSIAIGNHPCADSLPICLSWEHIDDPIAVDVDKFEQQRAGRRRKGANLTLTYFEKKNMLKRIAGVTEGDIRRAQDTTSMRLQRDRPVAGGERQLTIF